MPTLNEQLKNEQIIENLFGDQIDLTSTILNKDLRFTEEGIIAEKNTKVKSFDDLKFIPIENIEDVDRDIERIFPN